MLHVGGLSGSSGEGLWGLCGTSSFWKSSGHTSVVYGGPEFDLWHRVRYTSRVEQKNPIEYMAIVLVQICLWHKASGRAATTCPDCSNSVLAEKSSGLQPPRGICGEVQNFGRFSIICPAKSDRLAGLCPALALWERAFGGGGRWRGGCSKGQDRELRSSSLLNRGSQGTQRFSGSCCSQQCGCFLVINKGSPGSTN